MPGQPRTTPLPLTPAQVRVLGKIAEGKTTAETAHELIVTSGTVSAQLAAISRKLGVSGRAALVHAAYLTKQLPRPQLETFDREFSEAEVQIWRLIASGASVRQVADTCRFPRGTAGERIALLRRRVDAIIDPHLTTLGWRYGVIDASLVDMASGTIIAAPLCG
ncbi:helix-turn-helix transcriptional regulator [Streptomyces sp. NPDC059892]|uniref:helix-turn-helix domain-containing protein n=1 Tax=Streptomyces sp. NPDC059892 TaxID=3346989 RepID=UPI003654815F